MEDYEVFVAEAEVPEPANDSYSVLEDETLLGTTVGVNDSLPSTIMDLKYVLEDSTTYGTLVVNEMTGEFEYSPEEDFYGEDFFTYRLTGYQSVSGMMLPVRSSLLGTVTLTVTPVNDVPSATDKAYQTTEPSDTNTATEVTITSAELLQGALPQIDALSRMTPWDELEQTLSVIQIEVFDSTGTRVPVVTDFDPSNPLLPIDGVYTADTRLDRGDGTFIRTGAVTVTVAGSEVTTVQYQPAEDYNRDNPAASLDSFVFTVADDGRTTLPDSTPAVPQPAGETVKATATIEVMPQNDPPVAYGLQAPISASVASSSFASVTPTSAIEFTLDVTATPSVGDTIELLIDGVSRVYEMIPTGGMTSADVGVEFDSTDTPAVIASKLAAALTADLMASRIDVTYVGGSTSLMVASEAIGSPAMISASSSSSSFATTVVSPTESVVNLVSTPFPNDTLVVDVDGQPRTYEMLLVGGTPTVGTDVAVEFNQTEPLADIADRLAAAVAADLAALRARADYVPGSTSFTLITDAAPAVLSGASFQSTFSVSSTSSSMLTVQMTGIPNAGDTLGLQINRTTRTYEMILAGGVATADVGVVFDPTEPLTDITERLAAAIAADVAALGTSVTFTPGADSFDLLSVVAPSTVTPVQQDALFAVVTVVDASELSVEVVDVPSAGDTITIDIDGRVRSYQMIRPGTATNADIGVVFDPTEPLSVIAERLSNAIAADLARFRTMVSYSAGSSVFTLETDEGDVYTVDEDVVQYEILVNDLVANDTAGPPLAGDENAGVNDGPVIFVSGTLPDGSGDAAFPFTTPNGGLVEFVSDAGGNRLQYTPARDYYGPDTFTYFIVDNGVDIATDGTSTLNRKYDSAIVTIHVLPINDVPATTDKFFTTDEDIPLTITAAELYAGSIPDADPMQTSPPPDESNQTFQIVELIVDGGLVVTAADGPGPFATPYGQLELVNFDPATGYLIDFVYRPNQDFNATDFPDLAGDPILDTFGFTVEDDGLAHRSGRWVEHPDHARAGDRDGDDHGRFDQRRAVDR